MPHAALVGHKIRSVIGHLPLCGIYGLLYFNWSIAEKTFAGLDVNITYSFMPVAIILNLLLIPKIKN